MQKKCNLHGEYLSEFINSGSRDGFWTGCCLCQKEREIKRAEIPYNFRNSTFDNYKIYNHNKHNVLVQEDVLNCIVDFSQNIHFNIGRNIILSGCADTGKTYLAVSLIKVAIKAGLTALFTSSWEMFTYISRFERHQKYFQPDLLVIDQISGNIDQDYEEEIMHLLIDVRVGKSTIFLTHLSPEKLSECLGKSIMDKLSESIILFFDWERLYRLEGLTLVSESQ